MKPRLHPVCVCGDEQFTKCPYFCYVEALNVPRINKALSGFKPPFGGISN
jgi:hypothetical protein